MTQRLEMCCRVQAAFARCVFLFRIAEKAAVYVLIYVDFEVYERIYLITVFQKADQENLSKAERNDLKKLVEFLELELERNELT